MKLLIAIPSKGRAETICKRTMRWITRTGYEVRVFVEPQEVEAYREAFKVGEYEYRVNIPRRTIVDIQQNDQGLGYAKQFIKDYAINHGFELVFKMDDDMKRFSMRGKIKNDDEMIMDFCRMTGECRQALAEKPDVGAIGFPYRNELFEPKKWTHVNARLQTCYMIRTHLLQGGFDALEDFAQYTYVRSQNLLTLRYGLMGMECDDVGKNGGGLQMFDRNALTLEEAKRLQEIYPAVQFKATEGKDWKIEPLLTGPFFGVKKL